MTNLTGTSLAVIWCTVFFGKKILTSPIHTIIVGKISPWLTPNRAIDTAMIRLSEAWDMIVNATDQIATAVRTIVGYENRDRIFP